MHARRYDPWRIYQYNPATDPDDIDAQRHALDMRPGHRLESPLYQEPRPSINFGELRSDSRGLLGLVTMVERTMVSAAQEQEERTSMARRVNFFLGRPPQPDNLRLNISFQGDGDRPMSYAIRRVRRPPTQEAPPTDEPQQPDVLMLRATPGGLMIVPMRVARIIPIALSMSQHRRPAASHIRVNDRDASAPAA